MRSASAGRSSANWGLRAEVAADTAGSARIVAERGDRSRAALAPRLAAEIYGLDVLRENVEDADHNTTRFVILSRSPDRTPAGNGPVVTSIIFRVRNVPAALYKGLGGFATNGVNMTKLESYQLGGKFFATQFLADIEDIPKTTMSVWRWRSWTSSRRNSASSASIRPTPSAPTSRSRRRTAT
jgi:prephenate dehydratase